MLYPQAPWHLRGYSLQTIQLLDIERVRPLIPSELNIVSVLPGKTVGGVYISSYGPDSSLEYNELIVASALLHHEGKTGAWVSHIYVDNPHSVSGGREIWGLPKELAEFSWQQGDRPSVSVSQGDRQLCSFNCSWRLPGIRQSLTVPAFSVLRSKLLLFEGKGEFNLHLAGGSLHVPSDSPFAGLGFGEAGLSFYADSMHIVAEPPAVMQEKKLVSTG